LEIAHTHRSADVPVAVSRYTRSFTDCLCLNDLIAVEIGDGHDLVRMDMQQIAEGKESEPLQENL
jgi:hypothetical protein